MGRLLAISDLHVNRRVNLQAVADLPHLPGDELILAGDIGDGPGDLAAALDLLAPRFARLWWVPGNHELWDRGATGLRGVARYEALVGVCRARGVLTPEDPFAVFEGEGGPARVCPLFIGYDFSFRPDAVPLQGVRAWAAEGGIVAADDRLLHADPFPDVAAWCAHRLALTERRLDAAADGGLPLVLVNHYPFRRDLVRFGRIARYLPWCGTRATERWHLRWPVRVVVHGHLHMRSTDWRDGVRFEEVALGYPRHWQQDKGAAAYLRPVLPGPPPPPSGHGGPEWHY